MMHHPNPFAVFRSAGTARFCCVVVMSLWSYKSHHMPASDPSFRAVSLLYYAKISELVLALKILGAWAVVVVLQQMSMARMATWPPTHLPSEA